MAKVTESIKKGGSGKWGPVPMPAQAALIEDFLCRWEAQYYAGQQADLLQLRQALRALRRALPWRFTRPPEQP